MEETTVPLAEVARILGVEHKRECDEPKCMGSEGVPVHHDLTLDELLQPFASLASVATEVLTTLDTELGSDDMDYPEFCERTVPKALDRLLMALGSLPARLEEENDGD